jgi:hypothetical protein
MLGAWVDIHERRRVAGRHHIEKRIKTLERQPATAFVKEEIERLRKELAAG